MQPIPIPLQLLLLLYLTHENHHVWCQKAADETDTASRILKQAIELSKHFMDPPSKLSSSNTARKNTVLAKSTSTKKTATIIVPQAARKSSASMSNFAHRYFNRSTNSGTTASDVKAERRMLNHEVRVVQGRCDINKVCPPDQYCDGIFCFIYKKEGDNCDLNGECERGSECQFGVCSKGVSPGDPGTFCDLARDCSGENQCCIRELSISHHTSICKPLLQMHESCGPINLFHQAEMKAHVEPLCGPCEKGLACKGIGIFGRHSICLPNDEE